MELWYPPEDRPQLLEWWRPLLLAGRQSRAEQIYWPIYPDEFTLVGRVDRSSPYPAIWVYRHGESDGEIYLDGTAQAYTFTRTPSGKSYGRFNRCDLRTAIGRAGLPAVVEPVWYERPRRSTWAHDDYDNTSVEPVDEEPQPTQGRRHGHLTVLDGGAAYEGRSSA